MEYMPVSIMPNSRVLCRIPCSLSMRYAIPSRNAVAFQADIREKDQCKALCDAAERQFGRIDICIVGPGGGWHPEGIIGQPERQWYFHRPLRELFNLCFAAGFVMDGIEEPGFPQLENAEQVSAGSICPKFLRSWLFE